MMGYFIWFFFLQRSSAVWVCLASMGSLCEEMGDDGLLSTSREHHLGQKPLKYLKMCPGTSPVHMRTEVDTRQPAARAGLVGACHGVSRRARMV